MSLKFYIGGSGSGKSSRLQEEIIKRSMSEPDRRFFVLTPDQYTMQTQKEMIERHPRHGFMNIEIFSFGRLAHYIFEEVGYPERLTLDDTGKNLILRKLASDMADELPVIGRYIKKTGYIHEVKSVISEFMQYGLDVKKAERLCEAVKDRPVLSKKIGDINRLYAAFLQYLGEKYITTEETMDLLAQMLDRSELIRGSIVALDGFTGFTPVQNNVLCKLLCLCEEVAVTVPLPAQEYQKSEQEQSALFDLSKKMMKTLINLAKEADVPKEEDILLKENPTLRYRNQPALAHLEQNLFRLRTRPYQEEPEGIAVYSEMSPRDELKRTFILIRRLIREKRYAYRDIAIVTGDLEQYAAYATELSEQYDVPIFLDNNRKLGMNPFTEYIKSGLRVVWKDFSYESVVHFLKCGFTGLSKEAVDKLENYILALKIRSERTWRRTFVRRPAYIKMQNDEMQQQSMLELNRSRETILSLLEPLLALKKGGRAEDLVKALYHFIADRDIYCELEKYVNYFKEQNDLARAGEYDQIYGYLMQLLEQIAALLEGETLSLEEFIEILEAGILEIQVGILPQDIDRVVIGDIERTRLNQIKALFFVGANEGIIPKHNTGGGLISDMDREHILEIGYDLSPTPRQKMYAQRLYLYMNMTKPERELWISYAHVDAKGKALRPSYLLETLHRMFPKLQECGVHQGESADEALDEITALKDGREYFAHLLRQYAGHSLREDMLPYFASLYKEYEKHDPAALKMLKDAAFYSYPATILDREIARALYGAVLENSISRMETFARCAYAHFLKYGMELREREDYNFDSLDMGNFFHQALEAFGKSLKAQGLSWTGFTDEQAADLLTPILNEIADNYGESMIYQDERTAYRLKQIHRILLRTLQNIRYQLKKGSFIPQELEYSFHKEVSVDRVTLGLSEDEKLMLTGKIDRYDVYENSDVVYVKVIDYKSRDKKIDLVQLYFGLQMQLAVYLEQAVERVKKKNPGKKVVPAALFYYPVKDPIMDQKNADVTQEEWERWMHEKMRVSGFLLEDEEVIKGLDQTFMDSSDVIYLKKSKRGGYTADSQAVSEKTFEAVLGYVDHLISRIGSDILKGNKSAAPCGDKACSYCDYREACCFDQRLPGFFKTDAELSEDEAMEKITETLGTLEKAQETASKDLLEKEDDNKGE